MIQKNELWERIRAYLNELWKRLESYFEKEHKRRNIALGSVAAALLIVVCVSTYSYFSAKDKKENAFPVSELTFEIEEPFWEEPNTPIKPGDVLPKDPQIVNTGSIPFVTRVRIEEVWTPKNGNDTSLQDMVNQDYVRYFSSDSQPSAQELLEILKQDKGMEEAKKRFVLRMNLTPNAKGWYRGSSANSEWLYYHKILKTGERTTPVFNAITIRTAEDFYKLANTSIDQATVMHEVESENQKVQMMNEVQEGTEEVGMDTTLTDSQEVVADAQEQVDEAKQVAEEGKTTKEALPENIKEETGKAPLEITEAQTKENAEISNVVEKAAKAEVLDVPSVLTERIAEAYQSDIERYNTMLAKYNLQIYVYAETVQADPFAWNGEWKDDIPNGWKIVWGGGLQ